ncbi:uncharacterized protein K444DRAFT_104984 [Hyaloscypha bicolor E]|uniref:Secreted protein n=1 Tax=Hyaloscypha bicolor E TaxID=1095630 RepID=A0A2J6SUP7_9HELO|nr:uncharacterized protein K444DRAFT_104984 [Hyaloscypha bicolor E]PMD54492.1 hypothetical protein K444DRAFT_104984 [Hyaloscypha bicolor E]
MLPPKEGWRRTRIRILLAMQLMMRTRLLLGRNLGLEECLTTVNEKFCLCDMNSGAREKVSMNVNLISLFCLARDGEELFPCTAELVARD